MAKVPPLPKASPRGGGGLVFSKETLDTPKRSNTSALSAALSSGPRKNSGDPDNTDPAGSGIISPRLTQSASSTSMLTTSPKNATELKDGDKGELATPPVSVFTPFVCYIFLRTKDPKPVKITVRITQECSKASLILALLQQTFGRTQKDAVGLLKSVDLRPADDDGAPDEDCPTLDDRQSIHRFGVATFTLTSREEDDSTFSALEPANTNDVSIGERDPKATGGDPNLRLLHAAEKGDLDTVRHLLETKAADVTSTGIDNFNCLHFAARKGHLNVVTYLLKHAEQLHIDSRTKNGWTPLHLACCQGHYDVAEQLLSCGADAVAVTSANATATDLAQQNGHGALVELVKEFLPA